jgi:oligopeptide transport system permease protein
VLRFILSRLAQTVVTLWAIFTIAFTMMKAAPGDPLTSERAASEEVRAKMLAAYKLDQPIHVQYFTYLRNILSGDPGPSFKYKGRTVGEILRESVPVSLGLGARALTIALLVGVPVGVLAAVRKNSAFDYTPMALAMAGICLPTFVLGPVLALVFGVNLGWFSANGWSQPTDWVLPSMTLGLYYAAYLARISRGGMLEVLSQDFIRTARAKGVPPFRIVWRHALRGGLLPVVAYLGPAVAHLTVGSFVVERIFRVPGMGTHFINGALNRDYTLILGCVVYYASFLIVFNLLADIVQAWMNPRQRVTH